MVVPWCAFALRDLEGAQQSAAWRELPRCWLDGLDKRDPTKQPGTSWEPFKILKSNTEVTTKEAACAANGVIQTKCHERKSRHQVVETELGDIDWIDSDTGFISCPGLTMHSSKDGYKDCRVKIDGIPTVYCVHESCKDEVDEVNRKLRSAMEVHGVLGFLEEDSNVIPKIVKGRDAHRLTELGEKLLPSILVSHKMTLEELTTASPVAIPEDLTEQFRAYMQVIPGNASIWLGKFYDSGQPEHIENFKSGNLLSFWTPDDLPFICPTDFKAGSYARKSENVERRIFMVVELDRIDPEVNRKLNNNETLTDDDKRRNKELSAAVIWWLKTNLYLHLRAVVDSGNKSLHAHFEYPGDQCFAELQVFLKALKCDTSTLRAAQPVRTPGYQHDDRTQNLLYLDDRPEDMLNTVPLLPSFFLPPLPFETFDPPSVYEESKFSETGLAVGHSVSLNSIGQTPSSDLSSLNSLNSLKQQEASGASTGVTSLNSYSQNVTTENPTGLTSLNSSKAIYENEWPEPLEDAAFHGVAGEIVRKIEPQTEADVSALLITLLTMFGCKIGRSAFMIADGSKHHMNLFAVIVGGTSKARKGTSFAQIQSVFDKVDSDFGKNNMASGLTSGEGLIYHVRDETIELRPIQKGATQMVSVVTDQGVKDKRLFVKEGEFANVLQVMKREGNTLSPVLRHAWDGLDLRTLTKNSPLRATEPHISILGHITKEELLRSLTATETVNGFANRFLFSATEKSKLLSENGDNSLVHINEQIDRLKKAIDFAYHAGEIKRDDEAKALWKVAYAELSKGKPGLLGSITARAEAYVMRLSGIYALLDMSQVIRKEHLLAAMAIWKYCENSARWIFGRGIGDKTADKILKALIQLSPKGITRSDIQTQIFQKNLPAFELNQALHKLVSNNLAYVKTEKAPDGKVTEHWFLREDTNSTN